ncbi:chaperone protein dnaJ 13-like [Miscanthus floridulus]|uniref:chaperone protein dnaJ 13-like n=1 Tax=Miscanthus floridulus TaxID=154761 RepID=UPI003458C0D9
MRPAPPLLPPAAGPLLYRRLPSSHEVRAVYRRLALKYHPDVSPPGAAAENTRRFIEVQEVYETLSDPSHCANYDSALARGVCRLAFFGRRSQSHRAYYHHHHQIQLVLGDESSISVGWQKKDEKSTATGEVKFGTNFFGASAHYTHRFSSKSHARIAGRVGSTALDFEIGGGRRISEFSTVRMMYNIGIQGTEMNGCVVATVYCCLRACMK